MRLFAHLEDLKKAGDNKDQARCKTIWAESMVLYREALKHLSGLFSRNTQWGPFPSGVTF